MYACNDLATLVMKDYGRADPTQVGQRISISDENKNMDTREVTGWKNIHDKQEHVNQIRNEGE